MIDLMRHLPPLFAAVRYDASRLPDGHHDLSAGANCQRYAYAVLDHFDILVPPLRSSELWADRSLFNTVQRFAPLNLLLFNADDDAYGAHVAVYAGDGQALHLSKLVGVPAVWPLARFADYPAYRQLLGGKRLIGP